MMLIAFFLSSSGLLANFIKAVTHIASCNASLHENSLTSGGVTDTISSNG
jgi:hypothetical protein